MRRRRRADYLAVGNRIEPALIVEVDLLAWMGEEDGMPAAVPRLEQLNGVASFRNRIRAILSVRTIEGVDFLPQDRTLECAESFRRFLDREVLRQHRVRE